MTYVSAKIQLKVADEVWIITALLHREQPDRSDFAVEEIVRRAHKEGLTQPVRPGFYVHVVQHCVANRPPNPGRYRMLVETSPGRRRLYRQGDAYHSKREGGKVMPSRENIPGQYVDLLDWYTEWSSQTRRSAVESDPLLALRGSGRRLWQKEHADDYVRRLREGWE